MKARHLSSIGSTKRQRGIVMFVALIVLVAMALAALALIRSVDTTTAVIGNLGFRQASVLPANVAVEEVVAAIFENLSIGKDRMNHLPAQNYYATKQAGEDSRGIPTQLQKKSNFSLARLLKPDASTEVRYVVERMCLNEGVPANITHCDMALPIEGTGTTIRNPGSGTPITPDLIPFYRLTVRVDGPRNTASFVQVMLR
jgi:type IV pilus assembly protein PilX